MFGLPTLDVILGLFFVYLVLSLLCTASKELIETATRHRAKNLTEGIKTLLGGTDLATQLYSHPLVKALYRNKDHPTYIPAPTFALALYHLLANDGKADGTATTPDLTALRDAIEKSTNPAILPLKPALLALADAARNAPDELAAFRKAIADWYSAGMDGVAGWYKRRQQKILFVLGLLVTILVNADTIAIIQTLTSDATVRAAVVAVAQETAKTISPGPAMPPTQPPQPAAGDARTPIPGKGTTLGARSPTASPSPLPATASGLTPKTTSGAPTDTNAREETSRQRATPAAQSAEERAAANVTRVRDLGKLGLPLGWPPGTLNDFREDPLAFLEEHVPGHLLGWLLTAFALTLGAPFWFDMLNKIMVVRSTVKPKEKSPEEPSKDAGQKTASTGGGAKTSGTST